MTEGAWHYICFVQMFVLQIDQDSKVHNCPQTSRNCVEAFQLAGILEPRNSPRSQLSLERDKVMSLSELAEQQHGTERGSSWCLFFLHLSKQLWYQTWLLLTISPNSSKYSGNYLANSTVNHWIARMISKHHLLSQESEGVLLTKSHKQNCSGLYTHRQHCFNSHQQ